MIKKKQIFIEQYFFFDPNFFNKIAIYLTKLFTLCYKIIYNFKIDDFFKKIV